MVDISQNRNAQKWIKKEQAGRLLWAFIHPLFRLSPRPLWGWRRFLLRIFGAKIGSQVHIYPTARIAIPWNLRVGDQAAIGDYAIIYALGLIEIGSRTTVSQYAHLCAGTHDWRDPAMPLLKLPIHIGQDAWICAQAFVGPGVTIGEHTIIGACSVVMKDVLPNSLGFGNPFRISRQR
jgi:putative colanic acid biosynthesis acetyltransferase WcaF